MKLSQLRALIQIAETGSFSEAALELGMSQSSVSEALSALENHLQASLVERGRFGARLTPLGHQVVIHARTALMAIDGIEQEVALSKGAIQGTLKISTFRSIASQLIPPVMRQLKQQHPRLQLELIECVNCEKDELLGPIYNGTADLAFLPQCESSEFMSWEIMEDPYMVLVPEGWLQGTEVHPDDLMDQPLIVSKGGDCTNRIMGYLSDHQLIPSEVLKVHDDFTMYNMVAQGLGICLSPRLAIDYVPKGAVMLPLAIPMHRYISLAVRQGGLRIPAVRHFIRALREQLPGTALPLLDLGPELPRETQR